MPRGNASSTIDKLQSLRQTKLFAGLAEEVLHKIAARATTRHLSRGQMLYSEREPASALFVVAEGELRSIRQSSDGREQVLTTERSGSILAAVPLFDNGNYFSTAIADVESWVLRIDADDMRQICAAHPELLWNFAALLSRQVRHHTELIELLALRTVSQRLANFLLTSVEDRAVRSGEGVVFELTITRGEIASRLGSVREVISRSLAHLHEEGLIDVRGERLITVPDVEALRRFANPPSCRQREDFFEAS